MSPHRAPENLQYKVSMPIRADFNLLGWSVPSGYVLRYGCLGVLLRDSRAGHVRSQSRGNSEGIRGQPIDKILSQVRADVLSFHHLLVYRTFVPRRWAACSPNLRFVHHINTHLHHFLLPAGILQRFLTDSHIPRTVSCRTNPVEDLGFPCLGSPNTHGYPGRADHGSAV